MGIFFLNFSKIDSVDQFNLTQIDINQQIIWMDICKKKLLREMQIRGLPAAVEAGCLPVNQLAWRREKAAVLPSPRIFSNITRARRCRTVAGVW